MKFRLPHNRKEIVFQIDNCILRTPRNSKGNSNLVMRVSLSTQLKYYTAENIQDICSYMSFETLSFLSHLVL